MAVTIKPYNATQVAQPGQVAGVKAAQTGIGDLGDGLQKVGQMLYDWQDEADTATAKIADAKYSDLIREELYGDQNGFMYASGGEAMQRRGTVADRLKQAQDAALANLTPAQRARAEGAIQARYQGALQSVDQHTASEGRTYLNDASDARVQMFVNDAIARPDAASVEISRAELEIKDKAKREGWSPEVTALNLEKVRTATHSGIVERIGNVDALGALDYLGKHKDEMSGADVARLEGLYAPAAKQQKGRQYGAAAASGGVPVYQHQTAIEYAMGPARPNKPSEQVQGVIGKSVQDVLGIGARVVITSGTENSGDQHGSNRHKTGNAADVAIYRPDGAIVKANDPEMAAIAKAAAANGAQGIGFGMEYMGGDHVHIDLVPPGKGQANTWASGGTAMRNEVTKAIADRAAAGNGGIAGLLDIEDPLVRKAAVDEYELRQAVDAADAKAATEAASKAAFASIVNGGSVTTLTPAQQVAIGEDGMKGLIGYEKLVKSGTPVETDTVTLFNMRQLAIDDPAAFKAEASKGFASVADKLSDTDRAQLVKEATSPTAKQDALAASTLMSVATPQLRAVGIQAGTMQEAQVQTQLLAWQSSYITRNGKPPTQDEVDMQVGQLLGGIIANPNAQNPQAVSTSAMMGIAKAQLEVANIKIGNQDYAGMQTALQDWQTEYLRDPANGGQGPSEAVIGQQVTKLLTPVSIDGPGWAGYEGPLGNVANANLAAYTLANSDITIGARTLPAADVANLIANMQKRGLTVTAQSLVDFTAAYFESNP